MDVINARKQLEKRAYQGETIVYRDFAELMGITEPPVIRSVVRILEALIREDAVNQRPLLAALVIQKGAAGIPRRGFFEYLVQSNLYDGDSVGLHAVQWHSDEIEKLKKYYNEVINEI